MSSDAHDPRRRGLAAGPRPADGLAYLPAIGLCKQTTIWGPGRLLYGTPTHVLLDRVSREPFHPVPLDTQDIAVRDLPGVELELGGVRVDTRRQDRHSAPSLGLRFDDVFAWITDTAYDPDSGPFAAGCRLLAHEAWFTSTHPRKPQIHSSAAQAAEVAAQAAIEQLVLIHLPPFEPNVDALLLEARARVRFAATADDGADVSPLAV